MKILKEIKNSFLIASLLLMTCSCENWLSVSPKSEIKADDLFESEIGFKDLLTGIYTGISDGDIYGVNVTFGGMDALGQQYKMGYYQGNNDFCELSQFDYKHSKSVKIISTIWSQMYNSIVNINTLLEGIQQHPEVFADNNAAIYKGEALGLRAMLHFDLLRMYAPGYAAGADKPAIPYIASVSKEVTPLSTVSRILEYVIQDLEDAAVLLEEDPLKTGKPTNMMQGTRSFHFNYYAAKALLARAYLYKNDKLNALKNAKEVIESDKFPWVKRETVTTSSIESRNRIFVTEGIFVLNNMELEKNVNEYLRMGGISDTKNVFIMEEKRLKNIFEADKYGSLDWRYTYLFEKEGSDFFCSKLWPYKNMPIEYKNRQPLLKLSEMYLIAAESADTKGNAVGYFNTLRKNRGFTEDNDLPVSIVDKLLQDEIAREYRKEFVGEGQWFFYCKRMDLETLPDASVAFNKSYYYFPLPDNEIEYGDRNL